MRFWLIVLLALAIAATFWLESPILKVTPLAPGVHTRLAGGKHPGLVGAKPVFVNASGEGYREQWARDFLAMPPINNHTPSQATVTMVVEWTLSEDGREGAGTAFARNNPLNTTQTGFNEVTTINDDGVKGYATRADGLAASAQTISYGYYTGVLAALRENDPERAKRALWASEWAGSHYGYGAGWVELP